MLLNDSETDVNFNSIGKTRLKPRDKSLLLTFSYRKILESGLGWEE